MDVDTTQKHPGGRPTKFQIEYCDELIEHMAGGYSFESFAGKIGVAEATINNWQNEFKEFLEAHQTGKSKMRLFWEEMGIQGSLEGKSFNASAWKHNINNKLKWKDRTDVTTDDEKLPTVINVVKYGGSDNTTL